MNLKFWHSLLLTFGLGLIQLACGGGGGSTVENRNPPAQPAITSFSASKSPVTKGEATTLNFVFANGTGTINNGIGNVTSGTPMSTGILTAASTVFTLTVTGVTGTTPATQIVTVTAVDPPPTPLITAPTSLIEGQSGYTASVQITSGVTYQWKIIGGLITSGDKSPQITFNSGSIGQLQLYCEMVNTAGTLASNYKYIPVVDGPPVLSSVTLGQTIITTGEATTLTAVFDNGIVTLTSNTSNGGSGNLVSGVPFQIAPSVDTIYTVTLTPANSSYSPVTQSRAISVLRPPLISNFIASSYQINQGSSSNLTAVFADGTGKVTNNINSTILTVSSGVPFTVTPSVPTTYTLEVTNAAGKKVSENVLVNVIAVNPSITSFTPNKTQAAVNTPVSFTAVFTNGTGTVTNNKNSSSLAIVSETPLNVTPTVEDSVTTYTLTVTNASNVKTSQSVDIYIPPSPIATSLTLSPTTIVQGQTATLTPTYSNGSAVITNSLNSTSIPVASSGSSVTVNPLSNVTYTLTVTNDVSQTATKTAALTVTAAADPVLNASFSSISTGDSLTLTPVFATGTGVITNNQNSTSLTATNNTALTVTPSATTTYILTVTSGSTTKTSSKTVTVSPVPTITSFNAGSTSIVAPNATTLTPVFTNGTGIVNPGNLTATTNTALTVTPSATTTYTLTVTNPAGKTTTATRTVTVTQPPNPTITSFTSGASSVAYNSSTTLSAVFSNGTGRITNGADTTTLTPTSGVALSITPLSTRTYTLTVTNPVGVSTTATRTVTVTSAPAPTATLVVTKATLTTGSSTTLTPTFTNGTGMIGTSGVNSSNIASSATSGTGVTISPSATTTYTLTVNGTSAQTSATQTVTVVAAPSITNFVASTATVNAGVSLTLTPTFTNGTGAVTNNQNTTSLTATSGTTLTVTPSATTIYTLTVNNAAGTTAAQTVTVTVNSPYDKWTTTTGSMSTPRLLHTATLLPKGKVLVVGGVEKYVLPPDKNSAELYDPATKTWSSTGTMKSARHDHKATLLPNGKVLVTGGIYESTFKEVELYDPESGTWSNTGSMGVDRYKHTATLLPNGKVLVAGGKNLSGYLSSAQLYDPATGTWSNTGSMTTPRYAHTATLLPNGKVLVAGGYNGNSLSSAELFDPATGTWSNAGSMPGPGGEDGSSVLLPNGLVLMLSQGQSHLYDPTSGIWKDTGIMISSFFINSVAATLLPNGKVLVSGRVSSSTSGSFGGVEIYDPATDRWSSTGTYVSGPRGWHTQTLLPDGTVLTVGGSIVGSPGNIGTSSSELYSLTPGSYSWTPMITGNNIPSPDREGFTATLFNGRLEISGGWAPLLINGTVRNGPIKSFISLNLDTGTWVERSTGHYRSDHQTVVFGNQGYLIGGLTRRGTDGQFNEPTKEIYSFGTLQSGGFGNSQFILNNYRERHTTTLLPNGKILVAGGLDASDNPSLALSSCERIDFTEAPRMTGSMATARYSHTATLLPNGKVLVAGGNGTDAQLSSAELFDPATGTWSNAGSMTTPRIYHTATLLPNGKVLVAGGIGLSGYLSSAQLYDPATGTWSNTGSMTTPRSKHTATLLPNGKVLVAGGDDGGILSSAELFDPATGTWSNTGSMTTPRSAHTATLLPNGKVIIVGRQLDNSKNFIEVYEVFK